MVAPNNNPYDPNVVINGSTETIFMSGTKTASVAVGANYSSGPQNVVVDLTTVGSSSSCSPSERTKPSPTLSPVGLDSDSA